MDNRFQILKKLDNIRQQTLQRLENLTQRQLDWKPPGWSGLTTAETNLSLGELFMHLAIDEIYLREMIARPLLEGVKPPDQITFPPPPSPYGLPKEAIRFWFERAREMTRRMIEELPPEINLKLTHMGGFEQMNGLEWLEAFGGHEEFHLAQIDELTALVTKIKKPPKS